MLYNPNVELEICIQNLVKFCLLNLKLLSKNQILPSNKGHNSVVNLQKMMLYNRSCQWWYVYQIWFNSVHSFSRYVETRGPMVLEMLTWLFPRYNHNCETRKRGNIDFLDAQKQLTLLSLIRSDWISNSSKLSCMLSLPASMKRIWSRTAKKNRRHCFSHYKPMGIFFRRSRAANSAVSGPIRPKFKIFRALMHVIITCKYKKERIKNSREKVETP